MRQKKKSDLCVHVECKDVLLEKKRKSQNNIGG